jgi:hypothetical protein
MRGGVRLLDRRRMNETDCSELRCDGAHPERRGVGVTRREPRVWAEGSQPPESRIPELARPCLPASIRWEEMMDLQRNVTLECERLNTLKIAVAVFGVPYVAMQRAARQASFRLIESPPPGPLILVAWITAMTGSPTLQFPSEMCSSISVRGSRHAPKEVLRQRLCVRWEGMEFPTKRFPPRLANGLSNGVPVLAGSFRLHFVLRIQSGRSLFPTPPRRRFQDDWF